MYLEKHQHSPWSIPVEEDVLDVNFRAIVSDLRAIVSGHLVPRTWADISGTWHEFEPKRKKNKGRYRIQEPGPIAPCKQHQDMRRVNVMMRILAANGMSPLEAFTTAKRLLNVSNTSKGEK